MSKAKRNKGKNATPPSEAPTLSVCMIVKNEEEFLPGCLESIRSVADEIVIVDTGSTDRTVEIAKSYGAKVYHHPWEHDFSKHRNQSISYATCDWILQIDADERLQPESAARLKQILAETDPEVTALLIPIHDRNRKGNLKAVFNFPRLFRNHAGVHYSGIVHNQVVVGERAKKGFADIGIDHFGYDLSEQEMEEKFKRTTDLLFRQLAETPDDPFVLYNLTNSFGMAGRAEETVEYGERTLEVLRRHEQVPPMYIGLYYPLINALIQLERYHDAYRHAQDSVKILPTYLDGYYSLVRLGTVLHKWGEVHRNARRYFEVREHLLADLSEIRTMNVYTLEKETHVHYYDGLAYAAAGDWSKANAAFSKAYEGKLFTEKLAGEFLSNLAQVDAGEALVHWKQKCSEKLGQEATLAAEVLSRADTPEAIRTLGALFQRGDLVPPEEASEFLKAAYAYLREDYQEALRLLRHAYNPEDPEPKTSTLIADVLERINRSQDARSVLARCYQSRPSVAVGLRLAETSRRLGDHSTALAVLQELRQNCPGDVSVLLNLGLVQWMLDAHLAAVGLYLEAGRIVKNSPKAKLDSLRDLATLLYEIGREFDGSTRLATARTAYEAAVAVDASYPEPALALAKIELRLGNVSTGVRHLAAVANLAPDRGEIRDLVSDFETALAP